MFKTTLIAYLVVAYTLTLIIWLFTLKEIDRSDVEFELKNYIFFTIMMILFGWLMPVLIIVSYFTGITLPGEDDGKKNEKETK